MNLHLLISDALLSFKEADVGLFQQEIDYYVREYSRTGFHGPASWYRTRRVNFEEDQSIKDNKITIPTLYVLATKDTVLTGEMSRGMEQYIPKLTRAEVEATHWVLWQKPSETNAVLKRWLEKEVGEKAVL